MYVCMGSVNRPQLWQISLFNIQYIKTTLCILKYDKYILFDRSQLWFFFAYLYKIMMETMWQKLTIKVIVITLHWKGWRMCMVFRISFKSKLYTCIFLYSLFGPQKVTKIFFRKYFWISWESYLKKWEFSGIVRNGVPWYRSMGWKGIQRFLLGRIDRSKP